MEQDGVRGSDRGTHSVVETWEAVFTQCVGAAQLALWGRKEGRE